MQFLIVLIVLALLAAFAQAAAPVTGAIVAARLRCEGLYTGIDATTLIYFIMEEYIYFYCNMSHLIDFYSLFD